jgi:hypothetical protein
MIQQGIREGTFRVTYPRQIGEVLLAIFQNFGETIILKLLAYNQEPGDPQELIDSMGAYDEAVERLLGMDQGTLKLIDFGMIKEWMVTDKEKTEAAG